MKIEYWIAVAFHASVMGAAASFRRAKSTVPDYTTSESGNPFVDGWYADPDTEIYNGEYWVFPTSSFPYDEQTYLDAFSSPDLIHWTKHPNILTKEGSLTWAKRAIWAPAAIQRNGKYYLYFAANDIQDDTEYGGIGVAVADRPEGPYKDPIGKPLIGKYHNGAQPIDQDVFIDDDGQAYIYYGGHSHANVAKLNEDMVSLGTFSDGVQFKEITPQNYVEGSQMFKRNGKYYLMWSEGGWGGPDYSVSYGISDSPLGPFPRLAKVLQQDPAVATGSGHNGVINVPDTDIWYIVYHRRPLGDTDGNHRQIAYDRMYFNEDGTIQPVKMLVKDNFEDGNMISWTTYDGLWSVSDGHLHAGFSYGSKAMLNTNFTDLVYDADITLTNSTGNAGVVFRATHLAAGVDAYVGYYAGLSSTGQVVLGVADGRGWMPLASTPMEIKADTKYHVQVRAVGSDIKVFVDDLEAAKISVVNEVCRHGADGVRVFQTSALFGNISVAHAS